MMASAISLPRHLAVVAHEDHAFRTVGGINVIVVGQTLRHSSIVLGLRALSQNLHCAPSGNYAPTSGAYN